MGLSVYIYHHLGLGDHIICNGLVRKLAENYENVFLLVKNSNHHAVSFMYRDLTRLKLIIVENDEKAREYLNKHKIKNLIKVGFENLKADQFKFDESFYKQLGLEFKLRWDNFKLYREPETEIELFKKYDIRENEYIFLHDDPDRGFKINDKIINNKNVKIIKPVKGLTSNIFHYCYILENASEIHCMDSSFKLLIDSLNPISKKLYHHLYVRGRNNKAISSSRLNWAEIYFRNQIFNTIFKKLKKV